MGALFSFLGGSAFRLIWGQISEFLTERQNHKYEIERMRVQNELDGAQHTRNLESWRLQADLGIKVIEKESEAVVNEIEMEAWAKAVATKPSGILVVDLWNGVIRPLAASIAIFLWVCALNSQNFRMGEWDKELVGVILGFYFATRILQNRECRRN